MNNLNKPYKLSIGMNLQPGAFGGGNQFGHALVTYLLGLGIKICYDLKDNDIDIILLTEPRSKLKISAYTDKEIFWYLKHVNPKALVVHRINECDERKGTLDVNRRLKHANRCSDSTVFISSWLKDMHLGQDFKAVRPIVIHNGADQTIFKSKDYTPWLNNQKMKIVTHHWAGHPQKGFDIYNRLDEMLSQSPWKDQFEFTYIGNVPPNHHFKETRLLQPMHGIKLAAELQKHHIYLTASLNEPAGMHHIEGALCGLPLLYRGSGALPEYGFGHGLEFQASNFEVKLTSMLQEYSKIQPMMENYKFTATTMCRGYHEHFLEILSRREEILNSRIWYRRAIWSLEGMFS